MQTKLGINRLALAGWDKGIKLTIADLSNMPEWKNNKGKILNFYKRVGLLRLGNRDE